MPFVLDTSVAMGWCFEDEATPYADAVLQMLDGDTALVPAIWPLEVANAICMGERRQRLSVPDIARFTELLHSLPITIDGIELARATGPVLTLARANQLSSYDASYLELATREGLPLATQDTHLRTAAKRAGVPLVE